jgi:putative membrane protein
MKMVEQIRKNIKIVSLILIIFYSVGIIGITIPATSAFFMSLTPFALILSVLLLIIFHTKFEINSIGTFFLIFVLGFVSEERGVNTGLIFGNYVYGDTLGLKLNNTPVIIGLNWLMMTYLTASVVENLKTNAVIKILSASTLMLAYDLVLEQLAPTLNMWSWQGNTIPLQNYAAWFVLAIIFQSILKVRKINVTNKLSPIVLAVQFLFFLILLVINKL